MVLFKRIFKERFPAAFFTLKKLKNQVVIEARTLRQVGVGVLVSRLTPVKSRWERELPVQQPRKVGTIPGISFSSFDEIVQTLVSDEALIEKGAHAIYLPPEVWKSGVWSELAKDYPDDAGLKVVKRLGGINGPYVSKESSCITQQFILQGHNEQLIVNNVLMIQGISPKLYDVLELVSGETSCVVYVVQHVDGGVVKENHVCEELIYRIKAAVECRLLQLVNWNGFDDDDFLCPECNGNLLLAKGIGKALYVDIQNFRLAEYTPYLKELAIQAQKASHFGDSSIMLGGKYLYQAVPGLGIPAKRDPAMRMKYINELLEGVRLNLVEKIVLDVGCNLGLMMAQYLGVCAKWVHGWDMPHIVEHSAKMLAAVGCTRFSLTGCELNNDYPLHEDIPEHLRGDRFVISYLSIRGHVGWLKDLAKIDWEFMIYEGHEDESEKDFKLFCKQLSRLVEHKVLAETYKSDGTSRDRKVAIILRG